MCPGMNIARPSSQHTGWVGLAASGRRGSRDLDALRRQWPVFGNLLKRPTEARESKEHVRRYHDNVDRWLTCLQLGVMKLEARRAVLACAAAPPGTAFEFSASTFSGSIP